MGLIPNPINLLHNMNQPRVGIVTGGNSGIGLMTAAGLAKTGAHVIIACRSSQKAQRAVDFLRSHTGNPFVEYLPLDLASLDSIRSFVHQFNERGLPLHYLFNNGGIFHNRGRTKEGFELIWGVNYLGHFLLTHLLLPQLQKSTSSHIIITASDVINSPSIPWHQLVTTTPWNFITFYRLSKLCLVMFTVGLARRLRETSVTVNAVHPGFVQSNITLGHRLSHFIGLGRSSVAGAHSLLQCALSQQFKGVSGQLFDPLGQPMQLPDLVTNEDLMEKLWHQSCQWTGLTHSSESPSSSFNPEDGIWGPFSLSLGDAQMQSITHHILNDVLPHTPSKTSGFNLGWNLLRRGQWGSFFLFLVQAGKQEFHMERHLDSSHIQALCFDPQLLETLRVHFGEHLFLWRSEIWVNAPSHQLIPFWHRDAYPQLLKGHGKRIHVYIAITEVNEANGFAYLPLSQLPRQPQITLKDTFSGNPFFDVTEDLEQYAMPVVLKPGQFVFFTDELIHRSMVNTSGKLRLALTLRIVDETVKVVSTYSSSIHPPVLLSASP